VSKNPVFRLPPGDDTPTMEFRNQEFARRLYHLLMEKGWSQSDLARRVYGKTTDARGYTVAKGRDRISVYLRGLGYPEPRTLQKIAKVLGVDVESLAPDVHAVSVAREKPDLLIRQAAGHPDCVHLIVNKIVPYAAALKVMSILDETADAI